MKPSDHLPTTSLMRDVWHAMRRAPYQAIVAILTLLFTFYTLTIFALIILSTHDILSYLDTKPQITGFFSQVPSDEQLAQLKQNLTSAAPLRDFRYVSQEEAFELYKQQNQQDPLLLEHVTASILPSSVEVSAENPEDLSKLANVLDDDQLVEDMIFQKDVIDQFINITNSIRAVGLENVGFLGVLSFLVIFVIMGMKVGLRRRQIKTLELVGATAGYIRTPFIIEGMIYGLIGAFLGWGATYTRLLYATPFLLDLFSQLGGLPEIFSWQRMLILLGIELVIAALWASLASLLAVNRFMRR